ncbi:MAG: hypothetical protein DCC74_08830 [Proteobacteria bacterium]|nr:MAG: hypothetical protein DCC74_08830 [Pseudomonadota bacterium]
MPSEERPSRTDAMSPATRRSRGPGRPSGGPANNRAQGDMYRSSRSAHWDASEHWDDDDEAMSRQARRLLARRRRSVHRVGDLWGALFAGLHRRPWLRRTLATVSTLAAVVALCFAVLWWRLGAGPINLDMATPWLASAIAQNFGPGETVEVGGTQIERAGRIRIAVRIRDIVVRDRDQAIVASAPKAEVRLSGRALLFGQLRAESLNLVDAELSVRIEPDGQVLISAGSNAQPVPAGHTAPATPPADAALPADAAPAAPAPSDEASAPGGFGTLLAWLDSLSLSGLDGQNLDEIGLKNGRLIVDDRQRGNQWSFENIDLSLRRPGAGGIAFRIGEAGQTPWSLAMTVGAPENGVRAVDIKASKVSISTLLLAWRVKGLTYSSDLPLTGEVKGEIGRDGLPTHFRGSLVAGAGHIIDSETPDYPMPIDRAEVSLEWDAGRRVLVAPFKIVSGENRVTLLAHLTPPNDHVPDWQLGLSGGTIVLGGYGDAPPIIFNNIAADLRFDTRHKRAVLTQANISNGEVGVAGTGAIDYAEEPRLTLGFAGTPMSALALKRMWPILFAPEVREWVIERIEAGQVRRIDIGINAPLVNLTRAGPPLPEDGLSVNILADGVVLHPVDGLPAVHEADLAVRVTGRTATVKVGQASAVTPGGRKLALSEALFEVPDLAPKPSPSRLRFRVDAQVAAAAEVLNSERLSGFAGTPIDPATSKGTVTARVALGMPVQGVLTEADTTYTINADLTGFAADKLVLNQKLEANALKVTASNDGVQVKGDVKINGQAGTLDYRRAKGSDDADIRLQTVFDDASRARLGIDLGPALSGAIPVKIAGRISAKPDQETKLGVEMDLAPARVDNVLPGWSKVAGRPGRATFNLIRKPQSIRLEDVVIDGSGTTIKGMLEVEDDGDVLAANFPVYAPSEGDKATLRAEGSGEGPVKVTLRGEVFDGRNFLRSAVSGRDASTKAKTKTPDFDLDLKLGVVAGYYGETLRGVDIKLSWRNDTVRGFSLSGKLGRDTPLSGDLRGRNQGREVIYLETDDAGAFFRFTDVYAKMYGGRLALAMEPPVAEPVAREGLLNVRDFTIRGESALDRVAGNTSGVPGKSGIGFSRMRAEFTRKSGQLTIKEGVVKGPAVGATIEGIIDYGANRVRMNGTFVPMYGLNNMFGQIPIVGLFLGGGSNEGLIGVTYEVVGTPGQPVLRVNPISAMAPGVLRKIFEFNTGRQNNTSEFPGND